MPGSRRSPTGGLEAKVHDQARNSGAVPIRLLMVDDERGFVEVMAKRLAKRNIATTQAFSGTEGIQQLRQADFDVAVLDLKLEDMDGIEILKIFKVMVPEMPVIMLTGHGSEKASREGLRYGACDYLTKPHELTELVEKIHTAVKGSRREADRDEAPVSG